MKHLIVILASATLVITGGLAGSIAAQKGALWQDSDEPAPTKQVIATLLAPPRVPPPINRPGPAKVVVSLETTEAKGTLANGVEYTFWTFGGTVPGPLVRVRVGDLVEIRLTNAKSSHNMHSIDLHAVTGPGGGAAVTQILPGETGAFEWNALNPGLYVYHCLGLHEDHPVHPVGDVDGNVRRPTEERFLQGPQERRYELARALRIFAEFMRGFRTLHFVGPCVTVFGSARFSEDHRYYRLARAVGARLALEGFTVMTGGGPGIMEAANRGAKEFGGRTVGCNIELPREQRPNPYCDVRITFRHFYVRKVMLVKYSYAFVVFPGGFGTLDEVFETATLVQTGKIRDFPLVLVGVEFWTPLLDYMRDTLVKRGTIDAADVERLYLSDSPDAVVAHLRDTAIRKFGLTYGPRARRRWLLWE